MSVDALNALAVLFSGSPTTWTEAQQDALTSALLEASSVKTVLRGEFPCGSPDLLEQWRTILRTVHIAHSDAILTMGTSWDRTLGIVRWHLERRRVHA